MLLLSVLTTPKFIGPSLVYSIGQINLPVNFKNTSLKGWETKIDDSILFVLLKVIIFFGKEHINWTRMSGVTLGRS